MAKLSIIQGEHRGKKVYLIEFPFQHDLIHQVKSIGCVWSRSKEKWYLNYNKENEQILRELFPDALKYLNARKETKTKLTSGVFDKYSIEMETIMNSFRLE